MSIAHARAAVPRSGRRRPDGKAQTARLAHPLRVSLTRELLPLVFTPWHVRSGDPATEILRAIDETKPAFVAMGTHGRKGLSHLLLGSVAEKVVQLSQTPVLTVHAQAS
jgi:nucleotide-binding universal stress UspA family protein